MRHPVPAKFNCLLEVKKMACKVVALSPVRNCHFLDTKKKPFGVDQPNFRGLLKIDFLYRHTTILAGLLVVQLPF